MSKKTSPWVYIGCGCAGLAVLAVTAIAGLGMAGWRQLRDFEETMHDPVARDAKVLEILGAESLPGGLRGQLYLRIPFLLELAVATDAAGNEAADGPSFDVDRHLLSFLDIRDFGGRRERFRRAMEEGENPFDALDNTDVDLGVELDEIVRSGHLTATGEELLYLVARSRLTSSGPRRQGTAALVDVRCPDDDGHLRLLTWFRADAPSTPPAEAMAEVAVGALGDPGDARDLQRLLASVDPCRVIDG